MSVIDRQAWTIGEKAAGICLLFERVHRWKPVPRRKLCDASSQKAGQEGIRKHDNCGGPFPDDSCESSVEIVRGTNLHALQLQA